MSSDGLLSVEDVRKTYGERRGGLLRRPKRTVDPSEHSRRPALVDVSLQLERGEILGIVGESGSGKTTVLRVILGLQPADSGSIALAGT